MSSLLHQLNRSASLPIWRAAQTVALAATVALVTGLVLVPDPSLTLLWNVIIPLVPASLLISPALWRNVCPLATLNTAANGLFGRRTLRASMTTGAGTIGIALLLLMVPARRFLFNVDATTLAVTIVLVGLLALALGTVFDLKAGFCNAVCPVLPVERLYGQQPLLTIGNPRCRPCTLCTQTGCLDLSSEKALRQTLGPARRSARWLVTGFGAFAAAFPGFVVGYYTTQDGPLTTAGAVYLHVGLWMVASYAVTAALVTGMNISARQAFPLLAATAVGLYYWFAVPLVAAALGMGDVGTTVFRLMAAVLVITWLVRNLQHDPPRAGPITST